ncbi:hypothetical protein AB0G02_31145 [Actinosynnema sp. NPDC023658]|uniref:hypothetical protein n=1 Tax=Actinosynnema sp. NPDC023658 TaxID=3155465 RepID=UPI0033EEF3EB
MLSGIAAAVLVIGALASPAASAAPEVKGTAQAPDPSTDVVALMRTQESLDRVADRIEAVAADSEGSGLSGFTVHADRAALEVFWRGAVSKEVQSEVDDAGARGLTVEVKSAPYTLTELRAETQRLADAAMGKDDGVALASIGPKPDGTGLFADLAGVPAGSDARTAARSVPGLTSRVPLEFSSSTTPLPASRFTDVAPYWGGAYMERWVSGAPQNACSTGFGVTGLNGAATYVLTAAHCGEGQWRTGSSGGTQFTLGNTFVTRDPGRDAELILTSAGNAIWDGDALNGPNQFWKYVLGASTNRSGDFVCTSGAFSGARCNIRAQATGQVINVGGFGQVRDIVRAEQQDRQNAGGNGDQANWVTCTGVPNGPNSDPNARHCSWRIFYPDVIAQMNSLGVRINT